MINIVNFNSVQLMNTYVSTEVVHMKHFFIGDRQYAHLQFHAT